MTNSVSCSGRSILNGMQTSCMGGRKKVPKLKTDGRQPESDKVSNPHVGNNPECESTRPLFLCLGAGTSGSQTLARPSKPTTTFSAFTSQWTTSWACGSGPLPFVMCVWVNETKGGCKRRNKMKRTKATNDENICQRGCILGKKTGLE